MLSATLFCALFLSTFLLCHPINLSHSPTARPEASFRFNLTLAYSRAESGRVEQKQLHRPKPVSWCSNLRQKLHWHPPPFPSHSLAERRKNPSQPHFMTWLEGGRPRNLFSLCKVCGEKRAKGSTKGGSR